MSRRYSVQRKPRIEEAMIPPPPHTHTHRAGGGVRLVDDQCCEHFIIPSLKFTTVPSPKDLLIS